LGGTILEKDKGSRRQGKPSIYDAGLLTEKRRGGKEE
jgi:hypothetical protein